MHARKASAQKCRFTRPFKIYDYRSDFKHENRVQYKNVKTFVRIEMDVIPKIYFSTCLKQVKRPNNCNLSQLQAASVFQKKGHT